MKALENSTLASSSEASSLELTHRSAQQLSHFRNDLCAAEFY